MERIKALQPRIDEWISWSKERLSKLKKLCKDIEKKLELIEESARGRVEDKDQCKYIDDDGFCRNWYWHEKVKGWEMKEVSLKKEKRDTT